MQDGTQDLGTQKAWGGHPEAFDRPWETHAYLEAPGQGNDSPQPYSTRVSVLSTNSQTTLTLLLLKTLPHGKVSVTCQRQCRASSDTRTFSGFPESTGVSPYSNHCSSFLLYHW